MTPLIVNPFFYITLICALLFCASVIFALFSWASSAESKGVKAVKLIDCSFISVALIADSFSFLNGIFYFDRSAVENESGFIWHGKQYVPQSGVYDINKGVAKTKKR